MWALWVDGEDKCTVALCYVRPGDSPALTPSYFTVGGRKKALLLLGLRDMNVHKRNLAGDLQNVFAGACCFSRPFLQFLAKLYNHRVRQQHCLEEEKQAGGGSWTKELASTIFAWSEVAPLERAWYFFSLISPSPCTSSGGVVGVSL